ncbi:unnamed protein product [Hymenolepis diminuta]|uniref:N(4)-(Beta-N-acetylglucosaminyl)-L-asparaginase n=1 Tax=Hymenolepis diminuta TaxID=6216 RepID=A0A3P6WC79_HYMDI|nr:unnamed protein product [Hymenolepis diminuta]
MATGEVYSWHQIRSYSKAAVISTWPWKGPNDAAWRNIDHPSGSAVSAVVAGCTAAEEYKSIPTVGAGGSPDENGNTTLCHGDRCLGFLFFVALILLGFANGKSIVVPWADLYPPSYKEMVVINTWPLLEPARSAFQVLQRGGSPLEAVVAGCTVAEADPNVTSVGYGGSPDEIGNTTLNAMVMDGDSMNVGAVAEMPYIKQAAQVALGVLNSTRHTLLVGEAAAKFAESLGYHRTNLSTNESLTIWKQWKNTRCQPNFRIPYVWVPNPNQSCGPYRYKNGSRNNDDIAMEFKKIKSHLFSAPQNSRTELGIDEENHDTIGVIALNQRGRMAVGLSTNGARFRIPGRIGDSPIPGAGGYADSKVGAAAGTGDGDVMMRFLLSFKAVELMRAGKHPSDACTISLKTVRQKGLWYGGLIALNADGQYGAACVGFKKFAFVVQNSGSAKNGKVIKVKCLTPRELAN